MDIIARQIEIEGELPKGMMLWARERLQPKGRTWYYYSDTSREEYQNFWRAETEQEARHGIGELCLRRGDLRETMRYLFGFLGEW
jgi:hypothetical protein